MILTRKIYIWMPDSNVDDSAATDHRLISTYPVDVSYQFTHHINHLIKTVFLHPVNGCGKISEMG